MAKRKQSADVNLKVRMKEPIRANLERAAKKNGVSMNHEAVKRLEMSFHNDSLLIEVLGGMFGKSLAMTLLTVGQAMKMSGQEAGWLDKHTSEGIDDWFNDPVAYNKACEAATSLLDRLSPPGNPEWTNKDPEYPERYEKIGKKNANQCIQALTGNLPSLKKIPVQARGYRSELDVWADDLKDTMGPLCDRSGQPIDTGWALEKVISKNLLPSRRKRKGGSK